MNDDSNNHINYERAAADAISYNPKKKHNDNNRIESTSLQSQQNNSMSREFHNSATDAALAAAANASSNHNNYNNKVPNTSADDLADRLISYAQKYDKHYFGIRHQRRRMVHLQSKVYQHQHRTLPQILSAA